MMMTENKISEIKLMSAMKELKDTENVSDDVVISWIYDVHSLMLQYRNDFKSEKTDKTTIEDGENVADSIVELAYTIITGGTNNVGVDQVKYMKRQFYKTMMSDSKVLSEAFAWNFIILMLNNFRINQKIGKTNAKDN